MDICSPEFSVSTVSYELSKEYVAIFNYADLNDYTIHNIADAVFAVRMNEGRAHHGQTWWNSITSMLL